MSRVDKVVNFNSDVESLKSCSPGPKVIFPKDQNQLPAVEYLQNYNKRGVFNCKPEQYPKFTEGKYCCSEDITTNQELLNYVNMLLTGAVENVNITMFLKSQAYINFLLEQRRQLLGMRDLEDNFDNNIIIEQFENMFRGNNDGLLRRYPNPNLDDWFRIMSRESKELDRQLRPTPEDLEARVNFNTMSRQERQQRNLDKIESIKDNKDGTFYLCAAGGCILLLLASGITLMSIYKNGGRTRRRKLKQQKKSKFTAKLKK